MSSEIGKNKREETYSIYEREKKEWKNFRLKHKK